MQKRVYTEQDIEQLEKHISSKSLRDATIFSIILDTDPDLSLADVLSLKTTDVIKLGEIKSTLLIKTKRRRLQEVQLSEKSLELLDYYTDQLIDDEGDFVYLFESRSKKGNPISNSHWNRILKQYCEEIGIENRPEPEKNIAPAQPGFASQIEIKLDILQRFLSHKNHSIALKAQQEILPSLKSLLKDGFHHPPFSEATPPFPR